MRSNALTPQEYIESVPDERKAAVHKLRMVIKENIPEGFTETMGYGMLGYVVPHTIYPSGYHCDPKLPLPFMGFSSQKNFIALYHMGIYADKDLLNWFVDEYPKYSKTKLDMVKSCIRFKNVDQIPFELVAQLSSKITVDGWINLYEKHLKR